MDIYSLCSVFQNKRYQPLLVLGVFLFFFLLPNSLKAATITAPPNNLGLVGYWTFNEGAGTETADFSGNGNAATITGSPTWSDGRVGNTITFDGTNHYATIGDPDALAITGDQTISMWLRPTTFNARRNPYAKAYGGEGTITQETNGTLSYYYGTSGTNGGSYQGFASTQTLTLNEWTHVTIVRDLTNDTLTWYFNGQFSNSVAATYGAAVAGSLTAYIGNGYVSRYAGNIDEVRMYNRALTAEEVARLYNPESARVKAADNTGLIGYWNFNEGRGTTAGDASGNGNTGTITQALWASGKLGSALSFDGVNDTVSLTNIPVTTTSNATNTVSFWMYKKPGGGTSGFSMPIGFTSYSITLYDSGGAHYLGFNTASSDVYGMDSTGLEDRWVHVVALLRNGDAKLNKIYIDGVEQTLSQKMGTTISRTISTSAHISGWPNNASYKFNGFIDDLRIYNRELSAEEARSLFETSATTINTDTAKGTLKDGLVGHWTFNGSELTSSTSTDASGSGNNGTLSNGPLATIGKVGQALSFDGTNDYINLPYGFSQPSTLAVSLWFKTADVNGALFGQASGQPTGSPSSFVPTLFITDAGLLRGELWTGSSIAAISTAATVSDGNWHHAVIVGNATTQSMYLDGTLVGSRSGTISQSWWSHSTVGTGYDSGSGRGGTGAGWKYIDADIDDVRVYNRALSADEIKQLYNAGK